MAWKVVEIKFDINFYFNYKLSDKKNYIYKCVAFKMFLISLVSFN
jgi:hypothetical protein